MVSGSLMLRLVLMALSLSLSLLAQQVVTIPSSSREAVLGERCVVTLLVTDSQDQALTLGALPIVPGLGMIARGPLERAVSANSTTQADPGGGFAWTLELEPQWSGEFLLPGLTVFVGQERFTSKPLKVLVAADSALRSQTEITVVASPAQPAPGSFTEIEVQLRLSRTFLERRMVQPFRQPLDLPLQLQVPWWEGIPGLMRLEDAVAASDPAPRRMSLVLNGQKVLAELLSEEGLGSDNIAVRLRARFQRSGEVEQLYLSAQAKLTWAQRFEEDFVSGRVAVDPRTSVVAAAPFLMFHEPSAGVPTHSEVTASDPTESANIELLSEVGEASSGWPEVGTWNASAFHWSLWAPVIIAALCLTFWLLWQALFHGDTSARRSRRIRQTLARRLKQCRGDPAQSLAALQTGVADWLEVTVPQLTGPGLNTELHKKGVPSRMALKATEALRAWSSVAYAPPGHAPIQSKSDYLGFLTELMQSASEAKR